MNKQARQQAITDIMQDLHKSGKSFLAFRKDLNETMDELVDEAIHEQELLGSK